MNTATTTLGWAMSLALIGCGSGGSGDGGADDVTGRLDALLGTPAAHPDGRALQAQIKAWRGKFFVFLTDRRVPATNNISEREIRPSVVFRKVTNGFRSEWGPGVHASYRSLASTARLHAHTTIDAVRALVSRQHLHGMEDILPAR